MNPESQPSEEAFLRQQAQSATRALRNDVKGIQNSIRQVIDPCVWTREFPWTMMGSALVGGFLTGMAVTPKRPPPAEADVEVNARHGRTFHSHSDSVHGVAGTVLSYFSSLGRRMLENLLSGLVAGAVGGAISAPPSTNGQAPTADTSAML